MANELSCRCRRRLASGFELDAELRLPLDDSPVTVLFGPSGAGKTTLLRLLAGLDRPDDGAISFRDGTWYDGSLGICLPPQQRRAVFLFQDCALFPHLTVAANVEYAARRETARRLIDVFGLAELADRFPRALSGGQQPQQSGLARSRRAEQHRHRRIVERETQLRIQLETGGQALPAATAQLIGHSAQTRRCSA